MISAIMYVAASLSMCENKKCVYAKEKEEATKMTNDTEMKNIRLMKHTEKEEEKTK